MIVVGIVVLLALLVLLFLIVTVGAGAVPSPVAHTDHPARHFDRTCPACIAEGTPPTARGKT